MRKITSIYLVILCLSLNLSLVGCNQITSKTKSPIRPSVGTNNIAESNLRLGIAYLKRGEYEKALHKLQRAEKADPNYPPTYNTLGILYQRLGDKATAEKHFRYALSLNRADASTLNNYGQFLCQEARYDEAEETFLKASHNPLYSTPEIALSNAGTCEMAQNKLRSAETYFRAALEKNPRVAVALIQMAEVSYINNNYLSARAYLQRYLEISSHTAKSLWLGVRVEKQLGDKDALSSYTLLLKNKFPDSEETGLLEKTVQ